MRSGGSGQIFVTQLDRGNFFRNAALLPVKEVVPFGKHDDKLSPVSGFYMYYLDRVNNAWRTRERLRLDIPTGNRTGAPAVDIQSAHNWFFSGDGKIAYTLDAGRSWTYRQSPLPHNIAPGGIRFFGGRMGFVWGGSINQNGLYSPRSALDRTTNGGKTWTTVKLPVK